MQLSFTGQVLPPTGHVCNTYPPQTDFRESINTLVFSLVLCGVTVKQQWPEVPVALSIVLNRGKKTTTLHRMKPQENSYGFLRKRIFLVHEKFLLIWSGLVLQTGGCLLSIF